jgi:hypothetical protein
LRDLDGSSLQLFTALGIVSDQQGLVFEGKCLWVENRLPLLLSLREFLNFDVLETVKIPLDGREVGECSQLCCHRDNSGPFLVDQTFLLRLENCFIIAPFLERVLVGREKRVYVGRQQVVSRQ